VIVICLVAISIVNGIRMLTEKDVEEDSDVNKTSPIDDGQSKCKMNSNPFKDQPCWIDYKPDWQVKVMKDIYNEPEIGGGDILKTTFKLDGKLIKNPMATFFKDPKYNKGLS